MGGGENGCKISRRKGRVGKAREKKKAPGWRKSSWAKLGVEDKMRIFFPYGLLERCRKGREIAEAKRMRDLVVFTNLLEGSVIESKPVV